MNAVIKAENLGKKYIIGHQKQRGGATLRDTMTHTARGIWQRIRHPLSPNRESVDLEELWALKGINFEVQQGERVGIIGANGAGKSTLLKVLSRITEPTTGKVRIKGRVSSLLEVGTGFHPELTGRENIFLNGAILGMTRQEVKRKFDEIVAFAELEKFLDTPVKRYSSGMYVRLAFAVAAHLEPEILIVDEVLAVGDADFQKKCLSKMENVAGEGRTVLFVSHNMAAILNLCKRAILLRSGRVTSEGNVSKVMGDYLAYAKDTSGGVFELHAHEARPSYCEVVMEQLVLRTSDNKCTSVFCPHDMLIADIHLMMRKSVSEPRIAIAIEDMYSRRITTLGTFTSGTKLELPVGRSIVRCKVSDLRLGPGHYLLSPSVTDKNRRPIDSIVGAATFDIEWDNSWEEGQIYKPIYGPVLSESLWKLVADSQ